MYELMAILENWYQPYLHILIFFTTAYMLHREPRIFSS